MHTFRIISINWSLFSFSFLPNNKLIMPEICHEIQTSYSFIDETFGLYNICDVFPRHKYIKKIISRRIDSQSSLLSVIRDPPYIFCREIFFLVSAKNIDSAWPVNFITQLYSHHTPRAVSYRFSSRNHKNSSAS